MSQRKIRITKSDSGLNVLATLYPEGMETVPKRVAIVARNRWMVEKADYVVSYVTTTVGGAAQFTALAEKKGKEVIRLQI